MVALLPSHFQRREQDVNLAANSHRHVLVDLRACILGICLVSRLVEACLEVLNVLALLFDDVRVYVARMRDDERRVELLGTQLLVFGLTENCRELLLQHLEPFFQRRDGVLLADCERCESGWC